MQRAARVEASDGFTGSGQQLTHGNPSPSPSLHQAQSLQLLLKRDRPKQKLDPQQPSTNRAELLQVISEKNKTMSMLESVRDACLREIELLEALVAAKNRKIYMIKHRRDNRYLDIN